MINLNGNSKQSSKCMHCGEYIGLFFSKTIHKEDGTEEYIHKDPLMKKDCFTAAGMKDDLMIDKYLQMAARYMAR